MYAMYVSPSVAGNAMILAQHVAKIGMRAKPKLSCGCMIMQKAI